VVLCHHGGSTLGPDVGMAYRRALNLDQTATATYRCLLFGDTTCRFSRNTARRSSTGSTAETATAAALDSRLRIVSRGPDAVPAEDEGGALGSASLVQPRGLA
jgi:hypothetical protein